MMNPPALAQWLQVKQRRDPCELDALLDDQVVFFSPVVAAPQHGKHLTTVYLSAAIKVFYNDSYRCVREVVSGNTAALEFVMDVEGIAVNGLEIITWNDQDKIVEIKKMLRPLSAINLIDQKMGELLAAHK